MKTVIKCAAIAGAVVFAAGSTAWAQNYSTNPGTQGAYSSNPGTYSGNSGTYSSNPGSSTPGTYSSNPGTYSGNPATQGYSNSGAYSNPQGWNSNQQGWNSGMQGQGTSTPSGSQSYSQAGYGMGNNIGTYQEAERELNRYGYNNIRDLRAMQGWSADAMRNGQRVHVLIGDNGLIATFPGR